MRSFLSAPICPACQFAANSRAVIPFISRTWPTQRFFSGRARAGPSRMVLSDRVARPPRRDAQDHDSSTPHRRSQGPFGGMNQTYANIREPTSRNSFRKNDDRSGGDRRGGQNDERRNKAMKMRGSLATISYGHRTRTKAGMTELESFDKFDLLPSIKEAISQDVLKGMVGIKPTPIQRLAIPALLGQTESRRSFRSNKSNERQEFLLAAETGSGKTMAYLLPVIDALKKAEAADPAIAAYQEYFTKQMKEMKEPGYTGPREFDPHPTTARPRVVVLVPTAELVEQVGSVAKNLSHLVKFRASLFSANISALVINSNMYKPSGIDLIVSTPHLLASMADSDPNILSRVSHLVVDEADSLFDRSFAPVTTAILDRALPSMKQLILCSATIPKKLESYLTSEFPAMVRLTTPNLHAIPRRVQLGVIDVVKDPYRNNKDLACADAIWTIGKDSARHESSVPGEVDVKRIMVFVNEREKTQEVANYLVSKGIDAVALHRDTAEHRQSEMLGSFTTNEPMKAAIDKSPVPPPGKGRRILPNTKVIVATDLASRGIDTLAVRHVILYDVPHSTIDFIHRLGRAGRMGRRGRGVVLVGKDDRKDIVAEVRESMFMGQALI
ncbi:P-loop containing nucleoside triphosphate hydrolase protein [Annulohypoxylon maeteangense]|uniref:P-loop containing nucleoside triphosphate hydrolase protein n=1 Tax=Annulohypoxylon maeteangense TaxID=1927788 RepID=UPI002007F0DB|nr:P-loop containing nucleoside triphosphate hydrolase protein [Annulohypoxylon maeteangense]KAI0883616.1 P-loop containing nucleoside triphosphate hydrolase protein [Annulohypoxylon maeteangense]